MSMKGKPQGLTSALMDFFGKKAGQSLPEFQSEVKALDDNDKAYFKKHLEADGYVIV